MSIDRECDPQYGQLKEQVKPITWTTTKPSKPGWYWWEKPEQYGESRMPVFVYYYQTTTDMPKKLLSGYGWIDQMGGRWSSEPIAEPQEVQP